MKLALSSPSEKSVPTCRQATGLCLIAADNHFCPDYALRGTPFSRHGLCVNEALTEFTPALLDNIKKQDSLTLKTLSLADAQKNMNRANLDCFCNPAISPPFDRGQPATDNHGKGQRRQEARLSPVSWRVVSDLNSNSLVTKQSARRWPGKISTGDSYFHNDAISERESRTRWWESNRCPSAQTKHGQ